jgi:hypothetical protein
MAASAAYSAYNNYKASEAQQQSLAQQQAFHREYMEELARRQEVNETLAMRDIEKQQDATSAAAVSLGRDVSSDSVLIQMETAASLGMEQILRDREEAAWEMTAEQYKQDTMAAQIASEQKAQKTQLFGDMLGAGMQASKYYDSGLPTKSKADANLSADFKKNYKNK